MSLAQKCATSQRAEAEEGVTLPDDVYEKCAPVGMQRPEARIFRRDDILKTSVISSAYPDINDDDFAIRLNHKKEFFENKTDLSKASLTDICSGEKSPFSLLPYQRYLVNFMSPLTPYRGILIFHGVGTGKTSTAISIAESFRDQLRLNINPAQRKVLVLALTNSIDGTFRNTLYNHMLEEIEITNDMRPGALHTTSNIYYPETGADKESRRDIIKKRYENYYEILGPDAFAKRINNITKTVRENVAASQFKKAVKKAVAREFSNRVIIVDEVHNIKDKSTEKSVTTGPKAYEALRDVLRWSENVRLILMSATPMFNDPSEIVNILNLLIANDKGSELRISDIFDESDTLKLDEEGLKILKTAARPYISYVRGYNPVSFPAMLEIDDKRLGTLYTNRQNKNILYLPSPAFSIDGYKLAVKDRLRHTKIIRCPMSRFQFENYLMHSELSQQRANVAYKDQSNACGIIFPVDDETGEIGTKGFENCFITIQKSRGGSRGGGYFYKYQKQCRGFLRSPALGKFSIKYQKILENILVSPGIAFVFCERIDVGVETLAMILDAHGFEKEAGGHYLQDFGLSPSQMRCSICNKERGLTTHSSTHDFKQARYVVLQHQDTVTFNNDMVERLKLPGNTRGEEIKVILGSPVTKESMDFANVRQIHIASAWFNMSRIAQIIGRGVRNCSHSQLPPAERNVVVFRYCTSPPVTYYKDIPEQYYMTETGDEYMWRTSEMKDRVIKKIERELKKIAFDCAVTRDGNILENDIDGSRDCDYTTCRYVCESHPRRKITIDDKTASLLMNHNDVDNVKFAVTRLFKSRVAMSYEQLRLGIETINRRKYNKEVVALALQEMLGYHLDMPEIFTGPNNLTGYMVYKGKYYIFQPMSTKDQRIPLVQRTMVPIKQIDSIKVPAIRWGELPPLVDEVKQQHDIVTHILQELATIDDVLVQDRYIDLEISTTDRILLLEYLIENDQKSPLLVYFNNFLLIDAELQIYGHFLSEIPRCITSKGWHSCGLIDNQKKDKITSTLYTEPDADFVGYMQARPGQKAVFKIINTLGQRDKTRLDLGVALNTLTKGKTCATYDRVILDFLAKSLDIPLKGTENKGSVCQKIEYAFRFKQRYKPRGKRHFLNVIEADQKSTIFSASSRLTQRT